MAQFSFSSGLSESSGNIHFWFRFFFSWIFPLIFTLVGGGLLFSGLGDIKSGNASRDWPQVKGVILSSELRSYRSDDGTTYGAEVLYQYSIQGVKYSSNQVSFGEIRTGSPAAGQKIVNRFPAGAKVAVYVNPNNAEESVLEPGISGGALLVPGIGAIFFCIGLFLFCVLPWAFRSGGGIRDDEDPLFPRLERHQKEMEE